MIASDGDDVADCGLKLGSGTVQRTREGCAASILGNELSVAVGMSTTEFIELRGSPVTTASDGDDETDCGLNLGSGTGERMREGCVVHEALACLEYTSP